MVESASTREPELGSYSSALLAEEQSCRQVYFLTLISDVISNTPNQLLFCYKTKSRDFSLIQTPAKKHILQKSSHGSRMHTLIPNPLTTTQFLGGKILRTVGVILRIRNRYNGKVSSTFEFSPGLTVVYLWRQYAVKTKVKMHVINMTLLLRC